MAWTAYAWLTNTVDPEEGARAAFPAFLDGPAQGVLWVVAFAVDLSGPLLGGIRGWRLSAGHFAERHGLIIMIALGESIVAVGVGAAELDLDAGVVTAAVLGAQLAMVRDSYSYLHLPMVAGIVLVAVGLKKTLAHVEDPLALSPS